MHTPPGNAPERREDTRLVEVSLLLTAWQFDRLAEAASRRGVTIGQMVRQITREFTCPPPTAATAAPGGHPSTVSPKGISHVHDPQHHQGGRG